MRTFLPMNFLLKPARLIFENSPDRPSPAPEASEGLSFEAQFEKSLKDLKFDAQATTDASYELLSKTRGYSLLRGEIAGKRDASATPISKDQVKAYIEQQGGEKYLREVFDRGRTMLQKGFEDQVKRFPDYLKLLSEGEGRKAENFRESVFGKKLAAMTKKYQSKGAEDLGGRVTFANAVKEGVFDLKPDLEHVVRHGFTYFEYKNRKQRLAVLKRKELETVMAEKGPAPERTSVPLDKPSTDVPPSRPPVPPPTPVDDQFHGPTVIRFKDETAPERIDRVIARLPNPFEKEGRGQTENEAINEARRAILQELARATGESKKMYPAELMTYTAQTFFNHPGPKEYIVHVRVNWAMIKTLVTEFLKRKTTGPAPK